MCTSQLPKNLSYTLYVYMAFVILIYFIFMRSRISSSQDRHLEVIIMRAFRKYHSQSEKSDFLTRYRESHSNGEFERFSGDLKYELYQNPSGSEVFEWIREAEKELHPDAKTVYECILTNFGGSQRITARIVDPEGGVVLKINQAIKPRKIKWVFFTIIFMFVMLCLHIFDYVKDVGNNIKSFIHY